MHESGHEWRPLPRRAVAVMFVHGVQRAVRENLVAFAGAGTGFAVIDALGWRELLLFAAGLLLIGLLAAVLYHRRFRFRFDNDSLRVRKGIFEQHELKVRFERVQNVALSRPLHFRPLGLIRVRLDTPGAAAAEVSLPGVDTAVAEELRERIAGRTAGHTGDDHEREAATPEPGRPLFSAGPGELFKYGLTSNQVWILVALFGAPAGNWMGARTSAALETLGSQGLVEVQAMAQAPLILAVLAFVFLVGLAAAMMTLSGVVAAIRFHGFGLGVEGERYTARYGLLDDRQTVIRRSKMHSLESVQTAVGRLLGQWHVIGHQTGSARAGGLEREDRRFLIPGIDTERLNEVVAALRGRSQEFPDWQAIDPRFRRMLWSRSSAGLLVLALIGAFVWPGRAVWLVPSLMAVNVLVLVLVHAHWQRWGIAVCDDRLRVRHGLFGQTILEFEMSRCQQVRVATSPYQRRHGLATLTVRLPHGEQSIPYLRAGTAAELANRLLLEAERSGQQTL